MNNGGANKVNGVFGKVFQVDSVLIVGALLLMTTPFLGWLDRPIAGWLTGYRIPVSERLPPIVSYGMLCFSAGLISLVSVWKRLRWVSILAGGFALLLALHFLLAFSILSSRNIIAVNELNQQEGRIIAFNENLPISFMKNPTFDRTIATDTIEERLYATLHFSTFGWYSAVLGSILILVSFVYSITNPTLTLVLIVLIILFMTLYILLCTWPYVYAELLTTRGNSYLSCGMYSAAINEYDNAQIYDINLKYMKRFHINIGTAYYFLDITEKADYFIYLAHIALSKTDFRLAIDYCKTAISMDNYFAILLGNNYISTAYVRYGIYEYNKQSFESAINCWKQALLIHQQQFEVYYYLCRAYYDIGSYEESLATGVQFLRVCRDKINNADMNSNLGDSYYKMKRYDLAREHYLKSIKLVMNGNQRALMNLVGR
jgi:tetratricopeptide (TPR) repeat protein